MCNKEFSTRCVIDGKKRNLCNRKFCLSCSPFGQHNTANLLVSSSDRQFRRKISQDRYRAKNSEKVVNWRRRVKQKLIIYKGGKCEICGYIKPFPSVYDFHHKDPNKKDFSISGKTWSFEKLKTEVDKCMLLCKNCHFEIHDKENAEKRNNTISKMKKLYRPN